MTAPAPTNDLDRRQFVAGSAALALAAPAMALAPSGPAFAQAGGSVSVMDLMAPDALPDIWIGKEGAPVTIVEYASLTCPHCAAFHEGTFKQLKAKYIDAGKVRFALREFPFDPLATAGFMLARCAGNDDKRWAMIDLLFGQQRVWTANDKPFEALTTLVKQTGMSSEAFEKCLKDRELYEKVGAVRDRASQKLDVRSTPTFFINGKMLVGDQPLAEFEKIMEPMLK